MSLYNTTLNQPFLFAAFLYVGMLAGMVYSLARILRQILGRSRAALILTDLIFLAIFAGGILYFLVRFIGFKLRIYYFAGILLGFAFYSIAILPLIRYLNCKFRKKKIDNSHGE